MDRGLRTSTLQSCNLTLPWLMRSPLSLCCTWLPHAVLSALNFLPKGAWLAKQVMCWHCPPCRSDELLQVGCLVAFIFEKLLHLARVEISWRIRVQLLTEVCWIYLKLILNRSDCAVRSWDLWRRWLVGAVVLLCYFYRCRATANRVHKKKKSTEGVWSCLQVVTN